MREEIRGLHGVAGGQTGSVGSDMQSLRASTRTLIAIREEMHAFIEEECQHAAQRPRR